MKDKGGVKMKNKENLARLVITLLLLSLVASPARAILTVKFQENLAADRLQYYWNTDANKKANVNGRLINSDKDITLDVANEATQAKTGKDLPSDEFVFGSSAAYPGSLKISLRVWDQVKNTSGGKYTALLTFDNPALSPATANFGPLFYSYIYETPAKPLITKVEETSTITLPGTTPVSSLKIVSVGQKVQGLDVEVAACEWTVNGEVVSGQTGQTLTIANPQPGQTYSVSVRYQNLWGTWGEPSAVYTHTFAGAGESGLIVIQGPLGPGIVQFGLPVDPTNDDFKVGSVTKPANLDAFIRALDSTGKITTFGWWDGSKPVGYIITWTGGTPTYQKVNTTAEPNTVALVKDKVYQLNLTGALTVNIQGKR